MPRPAAAPFVRRMGHERSPDNATVRKRKLRGPARDLHPDGDGGIHHKKEDRPDRNGQGDAENCGHMPAAWNPPGGRSDGLPGRQRNGARGGRHIHHRQPLPGGAAGKKKCLTEGAGYDMIYHYQFLYPLEKPYFTGWSFFALNLISTLVVIILLNQLKLHELMLGKDKDFRETLFRGIYGKEISGK